MNCAADAKKFAVIVRERKWSVGSPASAQRLSWGLVRNVPRESLSADVWMESSSLVVDLHAWVYIGES